MDAHNPRYADGSVVHVGDTVEFDKTAADRSYAGLVRDMDSLIGIKLLVKEIVSSHVYNGGEVAILDLEALNDLSDRGVLNRWTYSSDMFIRSSECGVNMADAAGLTEFLEGV